jgi:hypothetical protein
MMTAEGGESMSVIQLQLPPDLDQFVRAQAKTEGHGDVDTFVIDVLRRLQVTKSKADLDANLLAGVEQLERGKGRAMSQQDWKQMRSHYCQRHGIQDQA